jgi:murein DD-endopeptidase MepM/ murein hydrolase activator NlpD
LLRSGLGESMDESIETLPVDDADVPSRPLWERGQWMLARVVAWSATTSWRMTAEWRTVRPVLIRYTGHLTFLLLAIVALFVANIRFPKVAAFVEPTPAETETDVSSRASDVRLARLTPATPTASLVLTPPDDGTITRQALPYTTIPERARAAVFTYTVQSGDTVFGIAEKFGLTPYTIYWANSETLEDNPHRLAVGMVLNILPVDGIYHIVSEGETIAGLAEEYGVEPGAVDNEWNDLEKDQPLAAGMKLVIPGGSRDFIAWQLPKTVTSNGGSTINQGRPGMCVGSYIGLPGRGWFDWPTGGRRISGWYFRDARNPAHGGLDIGLRTGDPVYAADGGVIIFAGWWGGGGYGNLIVIDHLNGYQTWYAHLNQVNVVCGQQVSAGDFIGLGGSTGWSSGPHLHLEIRLEGVPYDPLAFLP